MSITKSFIEDQEYHPAILCALSYLDENNMLPESSMRGIARSVIKKERPDQLNTKSQRWEFYNSIEPFLENIECENFDCNHKIGLLNFENAYEYKSIYGELLCPDCLLNKGRAK